VTRAGPASSSWNSLTCQAPRCFSSRSTRMRSPGAPSCSAVASVLTVKPLAIATSSTWSPRRMTGSGRACRADAVAAVVWRASAEGTSDTRMRQPKGTQRTARAPAIGSPISTGCGQACNLRRRSIGVVAPPGSPILAPSAAATRLSSISRFSKPCASAGSGKASRAMGNAQRRKIGTMAVTPDIWSALRKRRAKRFSAS